MWHWLPPPGACWASNWTAFTFLFAEFSRTFLIVMLKTPVSIPDYCHNFNKQCRNANGVCHQLLFENTYLKSYTEFSQIKGNKTALHCEVPQNRNFSFIFFSATLLPLASTITFQLISPMIPFWTAMLTLKLLPYHYLSDFKCTYIRTPPPRGAAAQCGPWPPNSWGF